MPVAPTLSNYRLEEIKELNPHITPRWNGKDGMWDIWFNDHINEPHLIMGASHRWMSDGRLLRRMQKNLYYRQKSYLEIAKRRLQQALDYHKHQDEHDHDEVRQMAKQDLDPVLRSIKSAGTSSHGDSRFKFQGYGEGILNKVTV